MRRGSVGVRLGLAASGVLAAVALAFSVLVAPTAEAATVLGTIRNAAGKCLENLNNAAVVNNKIQTNACATGTAANAQQFSRWADGTIRARAGGCLEVYRAATAANSVVVLNNCNAASAAQRWTFRSDGLIVNQGANRCLTPYNASTANGTWAVIANCALTAAQRWTSPAQSTPTAPPTTTTTVPPTTTTVPPTTTTVPPTTTLPTTTPPTTTPPTTTTTSPTTTTTPPPSGRNPLLQPFSSTSIWNMPIGSGARFTPANLPALPGGAAAERVPGIDDEPLVLTPNAPQTQILYSPGGWGGDRCQTTPNQVLATVPIPAGYVLPSDNKNQSAAFLAADGRTVVQTQPLARCAANGPATSYVRVPDQDIYGPGIEGSHGGSGMSALGGSIRIGELRPGQQGPRHALKINLYAKAELFRCTTRADCFRWPAVKPDGYAVGWYGTVGTTAPSAMRMGALLALPPTVSISSLGLRTEPGRQLAWTMQNYGAYVVDDTYGPSFALNAENGPGGNMRTQFRSDYGFDFQQDADDNSAWTQDLTRIRQALQVVDNNGPSSIGGGGTPRQPLLPELTPPS